MRVLRAVLIVIVLAGVSFAGGILVMDLAMGIVVGKGDVTTVPDIAGLHHDEAVRVLDKARLYLLVEREMHDAEADSGFVLRQRPGPDERVKEGRRIAVVLSSGPERSVIPEVAGRRVRQARIALSDEGLSVEQVLRVHHEQIERDVVIASAPVAGTPAVGGEGISLLVSLGPEPSRYLMPWLGGETLADVRRCLRLFELPLSRVQYRSEPEEKNDKVLEQTPPPGARVDRETSIEVVVSSP